MLRMVKSGKRNTPVFIIALELGASHLALNSASLQNGVSQQQTFPSWLPLVIVSPHAKSAISGKQDWVVVVCVLF